MVKGVARFGHAVVATAALATAVVLLVVPTPAADRSPLRDLDRSAFVGGPSPVLVGVAVGNRLRPRVPDRYQVAGTLPWPSVADVRGPG
ncbi:hypothetical protein [Haloglomus irregulare]|uniref:hypothetical protein n=1 Tax=Haloglomus irregulare TaxID=2234134 RepID=UPI001186E3F9|nr:hypothetical protein [Haloglomus irregulare]